jgi:hypothetical protein
VKKILLWLVVIVVVLVGGGLAYLSMMKPAQRPATTEKLEATPARLERGRYLAETVLGCFGCHSQLDFTREHHAGQRDRSRRLER